MKTNITILTAVALLVAFSLNAQVAINTDGAAPHSSTMLDIQSGNRGTSFPNLNIADMSTADPVTSPKTGLIAYNTNGTTGPGLVMWTGSRWVMFELQGTCWSLTGNAGTTPGTHFIGTTDPVDFAIYTNDSEKMRVASTGEVVVNRNAPLFLGDIFSSFSSGANYAINGYADGTGVAIYGDHTGSGYAIRGNNAGTGTGIFGSTAVYGSFGIIGINFANTISGVPVVGISGGAGNISGTTKLVSLVDHETGVTGTGTGTGGVGIVGFTFDSSTSSDEMAGFFEADFDGDTDTHDGPTVRLAGYDNTNSNQYGVYAYVPQSSNNSVAIKGVYTGGGNRNATGVTGDASSANDGYGYGVRGYGDRYGVWGDETGTNYSWNYAVYANGDMGASGTKSFMIDHPLNPENKFLKHYSIESDQVLLQYRGMEMFDANGEAVVELPEYYYDININASYQLTAVGAAMPNLYIKRKVDQTNTFVIAGGIQGKEVSWMVISERNDPYMKQYPDQRANIIEKEEYERGKYLMPELYGQPEEKSIDRYIIDKRSSSHENIKVIKKTVEIQDAEKEIQVKKEIEDTEK
jgi:hypothetical protein